MTAVEGATNRFDGRSMAGTILTEPQTVGPVRTQELDTPLVELSMEERMRRFGTETPQIHAAEDISHVVDGQEFYALLRDHPSGDEKAQIRQRLLEIIGSANTIAQTYGIELNEGKPESPVKDLSLSRGVTVAPLPRNVNLP